MPATCLELACLLTAALTASSPARAPRPSVARPAVTLVSTLVGGALSLGERGAGTRAALVAGVATLLARGAPAAATDLRLARLTLAPEVVPGYAGIVASLRF
jgi:hypothetical protein